MKGDNQDEWTLELQNLRVSGQKMKGEMLGLKEEKTWNKEGFLGSLVFFLIVFLHLNLSHHNAPSPNTLP